MPADSVTEQLERIVETFGLGGAVAVQLERPRNPDHGDLSTNLALILAKRVGEKPQALAQNIIDKLDLPAAGLRAAEIAGVGGLGRGRQMINRAWCRLGYHQLRKGMHDTGSRGVGGHLEQPVAQSRIILSHGAKHEQP